MMDRMVLASHDRINIPIHRIMNVCCPNGREENHGRVCEVMTWDDGEAKDVGTSLEHTIKGVEGNTCPWSESIRSAIFVMGHMNVM